ncbi:MAG: hypothetical protein LBE70_01630 [Nitrososphaerota archaeon]|jgi:N-acetylneuraminic acid mutarotase|nr:hypothetical protein [Nitrososphaerota archaeon]
MNKFIAVILLFLFVNGSFVVVFSSVSASELIEDSWNTKTPMKQARLDLGAVAVNGKIYAIGGISDGVGYVGANERYDPATDMWVTLASMPTPRTGFAITACGDKIYCIGGYGYDESGLIPKTSRDVNEVYDIASDSWSVKTPLPVSEYFIQAHVVDGKIFVVTQQALYVYDPVNDSWTNKTSIPTQRIHAFSAVVDNKIIIVDQISQRNYTLDYVDVSDVTMKVMIYDTKKDVWSEGQSSPEYIRNPDSLIRPVVVGATTGSYAQKKLYVIENNYVYDPVENTWLTFTGPSKSVIGYGVAAVDDILYVFGGIHHPHVENMQYVPIDHKNAVPASEPPKPTTDFWSTKTSMSQARFGLGVVAVNSKIYAIGGSKDTGLKNSLTGINERYDTVTDTWTTLEPMPTPRTYLAIAAYQDKIYCIGGRSFELGAQIDCNIVEVYDIATNEWSTKSFSPINGRLQAYVIQEKIFVIKLSSYQENNLYMYDPATDEWTEKTSLPYIHNLLQISATVDNKLVVMGSFMFNQLSANGTDSELTSEQKTLIYDPKTDSWSEKQATFPILGYVVTGVTTGVYAPQKIYVPTIFDTCVYDPESDTWSNAQIMSPARTDFGVAVVDDTLYVIGGLTHIPKMTSSSMNEQYIPIDYDCTVADSDEPTPSNPISIYYIIAVLLTTISGLSVAVLGLYLKRQKRRSTRTPLKTRPIFISDTEKR